MADLTKAFDFDHPDCSIPKALNATYPSTDKTGQWNGYAVCEATYNVTRPPVPYGQQTEANSLVSEQGFKAVRGQLTEGRYLTFEMNGYALTSARGKLAASKATSKHNSKAQRFVIHQSGSKYAIVSAFDGTSVSGPGSMRPGRYSAAATKFTSTDLANGQGYAVKANNGQYLTVGAHATGRYSVSYDN
ncbi:hypothetical protein LTR17_026681 [Elasticomyces elasticus]|nr:hypothetical protein LTR17_026681 [Elasticomyces elasticus]